ncbi:hypothetical protein BKA82DRAFT_532917 [Pisolithus tinctorius]|uniref:Uncharacterized protein n=1 Tax=Pisolithus tinctorius Marx 270 TaxID=870435 RepID=A0A0C3J7P1_PISTI|nr:hypothetical protein BKA82DRAFT_532917 [Pisolithus tinctorius]KIO05068.1 hypothetical protein M404DRAFT_532917 [Pisolithus tinctorius Marx 270]
MTRVKTRCEESHMDEQERIQAAISMTLCELATARHYAPPLECAAFSKGQQRPPDSFAQSACVEYTSVFHSIICHSATHCRYRMTEHCPGVLNFGQVTLDISVNFVSWTVARDR